MAYLLGLVTGFILGPLVWAGVNWLKGRIGS